MSFVGPGPQKTPLGDDQILPALGIKGEGVVILDAEGPELVIPLPAGARILKLSAVIAPVTAGQQINWLAKEGGAVKTGASDYLIAYDIIYNPSGTPVAAIGSNQAVAYGQLAYVSTTGVPTLIEATFAIGSPTIPVQTSSVSQFSAYTTAQTQSGGWISTIRTVAANVEAIHVRAGSGNLRAGSMIR